MLLGGDVETTTAQCSGQCPVASAAQTLSAPDPAPPRPATLGVFPRPRTDDVNPAAPVSVAAFSGTIYDVTMVNDSGKPVPGVLTRDRRGWHPTSQLGYGRTYTMTITARGPGGMPSRETSSFTTLSPDYQAAVYLDTTAGPPIQDGGTYGIGTVVVARFDAPIADRAAAERHLHVTANPPVAGSWNWLDDQTAHWRPEKYYAPGTSVSVSADIYGTGSATASTAKRMNTSPSRSEIPTSRSPTTRQNKSACSTTASSSGPCRPRWAWAAPRPSAAPPCRSGRRRASTPSMDKANPVVMDSSTFGLPIGSRLGYRVTIPYATRISTDGIYLHQLNATVWAQGNTNTSHGCLNLNGDNAKWFFNFSVPGDVVEVRNTGGPPLQLSQGGDWSVPWNQWRQGSALNT